MGRTHASLVPKLWCECHQPGGVTNTPPERHATLIGFIISPSESISGPMEVQTVPLADIAKSKATELCLCGLWVSNGLMTFRSDHRDGVRVFVCCVYLFPNRTPRRFFGVPSLGSVGWMLFTNDLTS